MECYLCVRSYNRKTINGEDILFAMRALGFENYAEVLTIYLAKYREVSFPLAQPIQSLNQGTSH